MSKYCFWFQILFLFSFLKPLTRKSYWLCLHCCLSRVCYSQPRSCINTAGKGYSFPSQNQRISDLSDLQEAARTPGPIELHFRVGTMPFLGHVKLQGIKPTSTLALPLLAAAATSSISAIWRAAVTLALSFCSLPEASTPRNGSLLRKIQRAIGQPIAVSTAALQHIPRAQKCFPVPIASLKPSFPLLTPWVPKPGLFHTAPPHRSLPEAHPSTQNSARQSHVALDYASIASSRPATFANCNFSSHPKSPSLWEFGKLCPGRLLHSRAGNSCTHRASGLPGQLHAYQLAAKHPERAGGRTALFTCGCLSCSCPLSGHRSFGLGVRECVSLRLYQVSRASAFLCKGLCPRGDQSLRPEHSRHPMATPGGGVAWH